eukprot:353198-Rhodomonas_salina.1
MKIRAEATQPFIRYGCSSQDVVVHSPQMCQDGRISSQVPNQLIGKPVPPGRLAQREMPE